MSGINFTLGGVLINGRDEVRNLAQQPIKGLCPVGDTLGSLMGGFNGGYAGGLLQAVVTGISAGESAAMYVKASIYNGFFGGGGGIFRAD